MAVIFDGIFWESPNTGGIAALDDRADLELSASPCPRDITPQDETRAAGKPHKSASVTTGEAGVRAVHQGMKKAGASRRCPARGLA